MDEEAQISLDRLAEAAEANADALAGMNTNAQETNRHLRGISGAIMPFKIIGAILQKILASGS